MTPLDPILASITYEAVEMLRAFAEHGSFKELARQFGRDERTVSKTLLDLDRNFHSTKQIHILEREPGKKSYRLTGEGAVFVRLLEHVAAAALSAVDGAASTSSRIPIPCTSKCLQALHTLRNVLRSTQNFDLVPLPRRTAELDGTGDAGPGGMQERHAIWFSSALMADTQQPTRGEVRPLNEDVDVLALEVEELRLLTTDDLDLPSDVTVRDVIDGGVTILVPSGGAAWQFLQRNYRDWHILRPFQHIAIPQLEYGLRCLANHLLPRSAMVVHGLDLSAPGMPPLEGARFHGLVGREEHNYSAVTGVFRDASVLEELGRHRAPYDAIWEVAVRHLPGEGRLF